ncbi:hypothetical protein [Loktanella sp. Alg231-35]|uniref:hypothetical protein n=1 Tax=Loktanella sp. Alg231-35 TaxID=1922220 RepID=UPI000D552EF5|nr:hypothetical protein [Loktanella sp. Alg231-35]
MKLENLYELVQSHWPEKIAIDDAVVFSETSARFPQLVKANDQAEAAVEDRNVYNDLHNLAVWSFYQEIHKVALQSHRLGRAHLSSTDVTITMFDVRVCKNLKGEGWEDVKASYERANSV